jgi:hypothetical protein
MIRFIKGFLIFILVVHIVRDTWVINTMEARMNARLEEVEGRLDSMEYLLSRVAKQSGVSTEVQAADLPHWREALHHPSIVPHQLEQ